MSDDKDTNGASERKPAGKGAPSPPRSRGAVRRIEERDIVRAPDGRAGVNVGPIYAAILELTGVDPWEMMRKQRPQETWRAIQVITSAITFLVAPDDLHERWLAEVPPLRKRGKNEARAFVVEVLRLRLANPKLKVHESLVSNIEGFAPLSRDRVDQALAMLRSPRNVHSVAARLSLACGAFGDRQRKGQSLEKTIQRIAGDYREAERDAKHTR